MSESDPTGYRESPDTTEVYCADDRTGDAPEGDATLTTDDVTGSDDGVVRPATSPTQHAERPPRRSPKGPSSGRGSDALSSFARPA